MNQPKWADNLNQPNITPLLLILRFFFQISYISFATIT